ncbi:MAG: DUF3800 domain-containing protein [Candidatus Omnitrophota bacterium]
MKIIKEKINYFFVDESGDPVFYNSYGKFIVGNFGCSKILMIGFIKTTDPKSLRVNLKNLAEDISEDKYLQGVPSVKKTLKAFHAKDDCSEVREKVFKTIAGLDFRAEFIVARKKEQIFKSRHHGNIQNFYDDLVVKLFTNKLHKTNNIIYFAQRGDIKRQKPLENAILKAKLSFESKWNKKIDTDYEIKVQSPVGEPCLQIADYMNWAVQRAFIKKEDRFLKFMMDKVDFLVDIYDFDKYPNNFYNKKKLFDITKISPL